MWLNGGGPPGVFKLHGTNRVIPAPVGRTLCSVTVPPAAARDEAWQ